MWCREGMIELWRLGGKEGETKRVCGEEKDVI